jgi:hypothetical protein
MENNDTFDFSITYEAERFRALYGFVPYWKIGRCVGKQFRTIHFTAFIDKPNIFNSFVSVEPFGEIPSEWLNENLSGFWAIGYKSIDLGLYFTNDDDAMMFRLKF